MPTVDVLVDSNNDDSRDVNDEPVEMDGLGFVFGVNDNDDNQNFIHDNAPEDAPFRDANGNPQADGLVEAEVSYDPNSPYAPSPNLEGFQLKFAIGSNVRVWHEPSKEYDLSNATFIFDEFQTPRWTAPDNTVLTLPSVVYLEGVAPGTTVLSLTMFNAQNVEIRKDEAKVTPIKVDIDIDSNNNKTIEEADDAIEMRNPGQLLLINWDDDNENQKDDKLDDPEGTPQLFRKPDGTVVQDNEFREVRLSVDAGTADIDGFRLTLSAGANVKLWKSLSKEALPENFTWIIGESPAYPTTIYVEGVSPGQTTINWAIEMPRPGMPDEWKSVHSDAVRVTVFDYNITGFRPQTEGPGYGGPFAKTRVPGGLEENPGVGIRRNGDDDNGNGTADRLETNVAGENDLIEVELFVRPLSQDNTGGVPGLRYLLTRSENIKVWKNANKTDEWLAESNSSWFWDETGDSLVTVWVEWVDMEATSADLTLSIWDTVNNVEVDKDKLVFYPFTSTVIVLGGEDYDDTTGGWNNQIPSDPAPAGAGTFQIAIDLYRQGYDVHMYNEQAVMQDGTGAPFDEVVDAVQFRGVTEVALIGYSHGGGAVWELANVLNQSRQNMKAFTIKFTSYIDAIGSEETNFFAEERLPPSTQFHTNQYQTNPGPIHGQPTDGIPGVPGENLNRNLLGVTHETIDDHATVMDLVKARVEQNVHR